MGERHQLGKAIFIDPAESLDVFLAEKGEVGPRPAEGGHPEAEGHPKTFPSS